MDEFAKAVKDVVEKCSALLNSPQYPMCALPKELPFAGIYIFYKNGHSLYVGRTNKLRKRLQYQTRNNHNQATFAFLLAREETGNTRATYKKKALVKSC